MIENISDVEKGKNKSLGIIWVFILLVWLLFFIAPFIVRLFMPNLSAMELLNVSFSSATALFTGIAFAVAFHSLSKQQESLIEQQKNLKIQQESLLKQTKLGVFSVFIDSMKMVTNSQSFKQCQDYILSENYYDDKDKIKQELKMSKGDEISLDDYSKVLDQSSGKDENWKNGLRINRDKIKTFCMRMEFMGIILSGLEDKTAEKLMLDLYGHTIKKTYKRLETLIEKTRENQNSEDLYSHYTQLYNLSNREKKTNY